MNCTHKHPHVNAAQECKDLEAEAPLGQASEAPFKPASAASEGTHAEALARDASARLDILPKKSPDGNGVPARWEISSTTHARPNTTPPYIPGSRCVILNEGTPRRRLSQTSRFWYRNTVRIPMLALISLCVRFLVAVMCDNQSSIYTTIPVNRSQQSLSAGCTTN